MTQTALYGLALVTTAFRLWIRRERYWWEDLLAFLAGVFGILCAVSMWFACSHNVPEIARRFEWLSVIAFGNAVWCARTSILVSIMRVSTRPRFTLLIRISLVLFILFWAAEFAFKMWLCAHNPSYICQTSYAYEIMVIIMDGASAIVLVALPIAMLWNVKLARIPKLLILVVFAAGVIAAAASFVHAIFLSPQTLVTGITANLQCAIDLFVCNLLVTVTFTYRVLRMRKWRKQRHSAPSRDTTNAESSAVVTGERFGGNMHAATMYTNDVVEGRLFTLTTVDLGSENFEDRYTHYEREDPQIRSA